MPVAIVTAVSLFLASCAKKGGDSGETGGATEPPPAPGVKSAEQPDAPSGGSTSSGGGVTALPPVVVAPPGSVAPPVTSSSGDTTAPLVVLGDDVAVRQPHTFSPTVTDAESITTYAWWQVDGPGTLTFASPDAKDTLVTASADGVYTIRLVATDAAGNAGQDELKLTWDTTPPTIHAGPDRAVMSSFSQDATPGEAGLAFRWSKVSGPGDVFFGAATSEDTSINISADGHYVVRLTATDAAGNSASDELAIDWDTTAPTVDVGPDLFVNGSNVDATATDATALTYTWSKVSGPGNVVFGTPNAEDTTITADADGVYVIRLAVIDALGNGAADELTLSVDSTPPSATLSTGASDPFSSASFSATVTFSEAVVDLSLGDFVVTNGTAANLAGSGATYTLNVIPTGQGLVTLDLPAGAAIDARGNGSTAAAQLARTHDSIAPGVTLASPSPNPTRNSPVSVAVNFSEAVTGFSLADIAVANGTAGNLSGAGSSYSFDVIPTGQGAVTIDVAAGAAIDGAGNASTAATQLSRIYDSVAPSVTLASTATNPTSATPITVTVTFSEAVTGFAIGDVSVTNGTAGNFSGSGVSYAFDVTPAGEGLVTVDVAAGAASDAAGNNSTAATQLARTFDSAPPSVSLSSSAPSLTNTSPIPVSVTFTEAVTGFTLADIAVTNGTAGNLAGSGASYTFEITPAGQGSVTADIAAGAAVDAGGNPSTAAAQLARTYDSIAPAASQSGAPTGNSNVTTLAITIAGTDVTHYRHKVGAATSTTCSDSSGYGVETAVATPVTSNITAVADGLVRFCAIGRDAAGNWQTFASAATTTWTKKTAAPQFTSLALANEAVDLYINAADRIIANALVGDAVGQNFTTAEYALVSAATTCSTVTTWGAKPLNTSSAFGSDGSYKVCARLSDDAGNAPAFGATASNFTLATSGPTLALTSATSNPTNANPIAVTATFSAAVTGFTSGDVSVTGGSVASVTGSGTTYTINVTPSGPGLVTVNVAANVAFDGAGNGNAAAPSALSRTYDNVAPTVNGGVTSTVSNGTFSSGQAIPITVTFSEAVTVTGTPSLTLNTTPSRSATYTSGSGTSVLTFTYTTQGGDASPDLDYAATTSLTGTIRDAAGNNATLTLPAPGASGSLGANKAIVIDTIAASITSVDSTSPNRAYGAGSVITIRVNYSEIVSVSGTPTIALATSPARSATYVSGDGTDELLFNYTVQAGDIAGDLEYVSMNALSLGSGGAITDGSGNSSIVLPAIGSGSSLGDSAEIIIDTTAPSVLGVDSDSLDGAYSIGNTIEVAVSFDEAVTVTGTPRVALNVAPATRYAQYTSGSGTGTLVFTYTVASGDVATDLDYASVNALELNGGTILDLADNAADRTLASPGADGSLGFARDLVVDYTLPPSLAVSGVPSTTHASAITLTVTFPANTAAYDEVQIFREPGTTAPADCGSGTFVESLNNFAVNPTTLTDSTGGAGKTFSYRVCAFDAQGVVLASATANGITSSKFHWMFTTSATVPSGNLGGLAGADAICQAAGETKDPSLTWVAVLSGSAMEARGRLPIAGPVYNLNPTRGTVASSHTDLWDGTIGASVQYSETGSSITTGNRFTGTASGGTRTATNCNDWTSNSSTVTGGRSSMTTTTSTWITNATGACNASSYRLLCASRTIEPLTGFTTTRPSSGADGDVTVSVDMPEDTSNWTKVEVRRSLASTTAPSCGSSTLVRTYSGPTFADDTFTDATGTPHRFYSYIVCVYSGAAVAAAYTNTMPVRTFNNTPAHLMFFTSTTYTGSGVGGLAGADAKCQARGDTFIAGKTWRAILSTSTVNANSRVTSSSQFRNLNGTLIANSSTDLFDGTIAAVVSTRETFSATSTSNIWTGSTSTGAASTSHCTNWTSTSGSGTRGNSNSTSSTWLSNSTTACSNARALFCVTDAAD